VTHCNARLPLATNSHIMLNAPQQEILTKSEKRANEIPINEKE
jgi:hypothetical protein